MLELLPYLVVIIQIASGAEQFVILHVGKQLQGVAPSRTPITEGRQQRSWQTGVLTR